MGSGWSGGGVGSRLGGGVRLGGGQGGCEQRIKVSVKFQKMGGHGGSGGVGGVGSRLGFGLGGQGGCERRRSFCENSRKKMRGGGVGGSGRGRVGGESGWM